VQLFYAPNIINQKNFVLDEIESKHAIKVLRLKEHDFIHIIDGKGDTYECKITNPHPKKCEVEIISTKKEDLLQPHLHIAISPTKNNDRLEWFIEKCTEIGISEITPILCEHSERKVVKLDRLQKTAITAMKQSLKATLPQINPLTHFQDLINNPFKGQKLIAHCYKNKQKHIKDILVKNESDLKEILVKKKLKKPSIKVFCPLLLAKID